jgi:ankyrin repeat protein
MFEVNGLIKEKTITLLAVLAEGAEVNSRNDSGKTPLHAAARQGHQEVVTLLIANGADVDAKTEKGETAISLANKKGHTEIVEMLRKHGPE